MAAVSKSSEQITNFKLAISAAKYLTIDLAGASGTVLSPLGGNEVKQVNEAQISLSLPPTPWLVKSKCC